VGKEVSIPIILIGIILFFILRGGGFLTSLKSQDSPFGIHPAYVIYDQQYAHSQKTPPPASVHTYDDALNIGIKWNRMFYFLWSRIQKTDEDVELGKFDWQESDAFFGSIPPGLNMFVNIDGLESRTQRGKNSGKPKTFTFLTPQLEEKYVEFLHKAVERYGRNGVKYWQLGNEQDLSTDDTAGYAHLMEISYKTIKSACPDCKLAMGGLVITDDFNVFLVPVLQQSGGQYTDIVDFHIFGAAGGSNPIESRIKDVANRLKNTLLVNGYGNTEIWITETGTYSGQPKSHPIMQGNFPYQTEKQQAGQLIKSYVSALSAGVKKVFQAWGLMEGFVDEDMFFDHTGLIYDGLGSDDLGFGIKKLSYYTYKKMVEILEGSDWNNIQTIQELDGVYIYKFTKQSKPILVVWNNNPSSEQIVVTDTDSAQVKTTEAIPRYESGGDVVSYDTAFQTEIKPVIDGELILTLEDIPVFIERA